MSSAFTMSSRSERIEKGGFMPAFGKDGIHNLNQSVNKEVWKIKDSDGKVLMVCDNEGQAASHRASLSQKLGKECQISKEILQCL